MNNIFILLTCTTFIFIFLRAFQQKNVMKNNYLWMAPTSYGMGFCEVYIIASVANDGLPLVLAAIAMGTGGATGSILATYLHEKLFK